MNIACLSKRYFTLAMILCAAQVAAAQLRPGIPAPAMPVIREPDFEQTMQILKLDPMVRKLRVLQTQRPCGSAASLEELTVRQDLLEAIQASVLDVDSVLAELSNERGELTNLRASLQSRRDRTVAKLNTAALITGSGAGAAVSGTQFTNLPATSQNVGDGLGIAAGATSTILSILATRRQHGPNGSVGDTPNMLAPLLGGEPVLQTHYPTEVLLYLRSVPASGDPNGGTRLEKLRAEWVEAGRLDASNSAKSQRKLAALTTSKDQRVKISIDDLEDRIAMLEDVSGRVALLKRDLALVVHSYAGKAEPCNAK